MQPFAEVGPNYDKSQITFSLNQCVDKTTQPWIFFLNSTVI